MEVSNQPTGALFSGLLAQKEERFDEAVRNYAHAAELEPSDVAYLLLAEALQRNGQPRDAQAAFEAAQRVCQILSEHRMPSGICRQSSPAIPK